jgi:ribose-phosphate pyrophosphokinase
MITRYQQLLSEAGSNGSFRHLDGVDFQFSDSETCVRLDMDVSGYDVFLLQALHAPDSGRSVDQNYMAFLAAARAFREWGANYVTGILPYLAYARQDKPTKSQREPTTAQLMAHLAIEAGISRLVTWHPHTSQIHGFYGGVPVDALDPLPLFVDVFRRFEGRDDVIVVAPDAGASKLVTYMGRALDLPCAIASKYRPRREEAVITEMIGDFTGKRTAIVLDDMISSGGTVEAVVGRLSRGNGIEEIYLAASHNLCREVAIERLIWLHDECNLREVIVTNSVPQVPDFEALPFTSVRCLADPLTRVVNRIHYNRSVNDLSSSLALAERA